LPVARCERQRAFPASATRVRCERQRVFPIAALPIQPP